MRAKFINEFVRGGDPLNTLGIGRVSKIHKCFRDLDIPDDNYIITPTEVRFGKLDLEYKNVVWLPNNLYINGTLDLRDTPIEKLPIGLTVVGSLILFNSQVTELPDDLEVTDEIHVHIKQESLIKFIENSKFRPKLEIYG